LREYALAFEAAASDHAIERLAQVEAQLATLGEDLKQITHDPSIVLGEPLALIPIPPPPTLERAVANLEIRQRVLKEELVLSGDPQTELHLRYMAKEIEHMKRVRDSVERKRFSTKRKDVFKNVPEKQWADFSKTRTARTEAKIQLLRRELEVDTGYREIRLKADAIRGPPDPVADMILASLREYDLDPGGWIRNEARLRALAGDLSDLPQVPGILKQPPAGDADLIVSLLSNEKIAYIRSVVGTIYGTTDPDAPSGYLFPDKELHHKEWSDALDREVQRRAGGSLPFRVADQSDVMDLLKKYTIADQITEGRAEAQFLQIVSYRFKNLDTMPQGLRKDVAKIQKAAVNASMDVALDLFAKYRSVSDRLARSTSAVPKDVVTM
jgi:hypothetical protein